ncbi:response regulator [Stakelama sp. CBK3Z-3]|uniref:Response regulator n=2 Tax=Stakelama flava TaxID=2860338 RepID=A0ABS6XH03_9SPHN|nr:response regulator [Stakelama flava]
MSRVLVVDDSVVARTVITRMVDSFAGFAVSATVPNAGAALDHLRHNQVDIILLDIEMPGVDGLTALPDLLRLGNGARIIVVSSACDEGGAAAVQALALGAADTMVKPDTGRLATRFADALYDRMVRLTVRSGNPAPGCPTGSVKPVHAFDIVAIGASTGGIHALSQVLRAIPPAFDVPILVTQHLPMSFMRYFATQLALLAGRPCDVASDHMRIRPGRIIVAPGDAHMRCVRISDGAAIRLVQERSNSGCMPSVDPMLASVAEVYGARGLAIVLSGMGRDGMLGAQSLHDAGGTVLVQDRESSVVWGMPGAIAAGGNASAVMTPDAIGQFIARSCTA